MIDDEGFVAAAEQLAERMKAAACSPDGTVDLTLTVSACLVLAKSCLRRMATVKPKGPGAAADVCVLALDEFAKLLKELAKK